MFFYLVILLIPYRLSIVGHQPFIQTMTIRLTLKTSEKFQLLLGFFCGVTSFIISNFTYI